MGIIDKVKVVLLLSRVADRLKEAEMKGKLWSSIYGLATAVVGGVVAYVNNACPALLPNIWPLALGAVTGGVALYMAKPQKAAGVKAAAMAIVGGIATVGLAKLTATCPDMMASGLSGFAMGAMAGLGLWLKSPKTPAAAPPVKQ